MKHHRPRLLFLLAVLCLAVCLLAGCAARATTADPDADLPTIVIGSDSYPPFNYLSADGQPASMWSLPPRHSAAWATRRSSSPSTGSTKKSW